MANTVNRKQKWREREGGQGELSGFPSPSEALPRDTVSVSTLAPGVWAALWAWPLTTPLPGTSALGCGARQETAYLPQARRDLARLPVSGVGGCPGRSPFTSATPGLGLGLGIGPLTASPTGQVGKLSPRPDPGPTLFLRTKDTQSRRRKRRREGPDHRKGQKQTPTPRSQGLRQREGGRSLRSLK